MRNSDLMPRDSQKQGRVSNLVGTKRRKVGEEQHDTMLYICEGTSPNSSVVISTNDGSKPRPCTGEQSSYSSKCAGGCEGDESVDYKKAKKRVQNRESAIRSRMKKKSYYEGMEQHLGAAQQENNKLKLDNAALRAENQLLKRYLSYFENLFAKKTQASYTVSSNISSKANSRCGLSDDEIYNGRPSVKKRQSAEVVDNEARDVSFVLERKTTESSGNSPGKLGLFSIALVMCVCSLSSFFQPMGSDLSGSVQQAGVKMGTFSGQNLKFVEEET